MFSGIVETIAPVRSIEKSADSIQLGINLSSEFMKDIRHGDSIAVNGVCLTVAQQDDQGFIADCMQETLDRTNLGLLHIGDHVNIERALSVTSRLNGHIVQGHVDTTTTLVEITPGQRWSVYRFALPAHIGAYVVEKGSITINGVSLTISAVNDAYFEVSLIPVTLKETILGKLKPGSIVNIEVDIIAKYVERLSTWKAE